MPHGHIPIDSFLELEAPIIDVRAPAEFKQGHIAGAINIPLFDDQERAEIGKLYKQSGRDHAVLRGLELVGPKMRKLVTETRDHTENSPEIRLHCWRGGMRSESFAWLLSQAGHAVSRLEGGYKAFRQHAHASFQSPLNLTILSGMTGAGKTLALHELARSGEQVIDLEGLANHRGSAFGGIGLPPQPTSEQFENMIFDNLKCFDPQKRIWLEDESIAIGSVRIPDNLWKQMRSAPVIFMDVPQPQRIKILMDEYGEMPLEKLATAIEQITKRLGGERKSAALSALENGDRQQVAAITLEYYDKAYQRSCQKRDGASAHLISVNNASPAEASQQLSAFADSLSKQAARPMKEIIQQIARQGSPSRS